MMSVTVSLHKLSNTPLKRAFISRLPKLDKAFTLHHCCLCSLKHMHVYTIISKC